MSRLRAALPSGQGSWRSFYSSLAGGVVTDSALMLLPIDDHMVHRGHAGVVRVDRSCLSAIIQVNMIHTAFVAEVDMLGGLSRTWDFSKLSVVYPSAATIPQTWLLFTPLLHTRVELHDLTTAK